MAIAPRFVTVRMKKTGIGLMLRTLGFAASLLVFSPAAIALPPPEDIPEEVLRAEIITEGRSPIDGSAVTAAEYAEIEREIAEREFSPTVNADIQHTIFLIRLLNLVDVINPF